MYIGVHSFDARSERGMCGVCGEVVGVGGRQDGAEQGQTDCGGHGTQYGYSCRGNRRRHAALHTGNHTYI